MVSVIDIAPTILEIAGIKIGENNQGKSFKNLLQSPDAPFRNFVFAEHNWHDYESHQRMVRNKDFMYIENNRNQYAQLGPLDALNSLSFASLFEKNETGEINEIQGEIFISPRSKEEFYDMQNDLFQRKIAIKTLELFIGVHSNNALVGKCEKITGSLDDYFENMRLK